MKIGLPLMNNVLKTLIKSAFISLRLMAAASATAATIQKTFMNRI